MTGPELKKLRTDSKLPQHFLAYLLGVSTRTVQRYESGDIQIKKGVEMALLSILKKGSK